MSCVLHATTQSWCRACDPDAESRSYSIIVGNPLLRETITGSGQPSPVPHVTIEPVATETRCGKCNNWSPTTRWRAGYGCPFGCRASAVEVRVPPLATATGLDAQAARIAGLEANVNEKLATIAALRDEIAQLRSVESVAIAAARLASLAAALRKALADVDPKAMSTYEQQQARREARALLEEVGR